MAEPLDILTLLRAYVGANEEISAGRVTKADISWGSLYADLAKLYAEECRAGLLVSQLLDTLVMLERAPDCWCGQTEHTAMCLVARLAVARGILFACLKNLVFGQISGLSSDTLFLNARDALAHAEKMLG